MRRRNTRIMVGTAIDERNDAGERNREVGIQSRQRRETEKCVGADADISMLAYGDDVGVAGEQIPHDR